MNNPHTSILIRNVSAFDEKTRHDLYAELKFHHERYATFQLGEETVIAVINTTEHRVIRLVEHHQIEYTSATREK